MSLLTIYLLMSQNNQKLVYLLGDFNINLLNKDTHCRTNDLVNILTSHPMYPSITRPTRITSKSASLIIDNIFTNSKTFQTSGIIITDKSDHLPGFITDLGVYRTKKDSGEIEVRKFTNANIEYLRRELDKVNWNSVCVSYSQCIQKLNELYDKRIPGVKETSLY